MVYRRISKFLCERYSKVRLNIYLNAGMGDQIEVHLVSVGDGGVYDSTCRDILVFTIFVFRIGWEEPSVMTFLDDKESYWRIVICSNCFASSTDSLEFNIQDLKTFITYCEE